MSSLIITHFLFSILSLLLQPTISTDFLAPLLSPFLDNLCNDILCGKGNCKTSTDYELGYICECDQGWKRTTSHEQKHLFLPCVIPNCTLDTSCTNAQSPSPQVNEPPNNISFFDPCNWAYCGEGSCKKASKFGHKCECQEGYANLLNTTVFPCFAECSLGMDCDNLNFTIGNRTSTAPTSVSTDKSDNLASSILPGSILLLVIFMFTMNTLAE